MIKYGVCSDPDGGYIDNSPTKTITAFLRKSSSSRERGREKGGVKPVFSDRHCTDDLFSCLLNIRLSFPSFLDWSVAVLLSSRRIFRSDLSNAAKKMIRLKPRNRCSKVFRERLSVFGSPHEAVSIFPMRKLDFSHHLTLVHHFHLSSWNLLQFSPCY